MRLKILLGLGLIALTLGQLSIAQEGGTSLADLARKEREKRKEAAKPKTIFTNEGAVIAPDKPSTAPSVAAPSGSATKEASAQAESRTVQNEEVGVRLTRPPELQVSNMSAGDAVLLECKRHTVTCFALVESEAIPAGKTAITDADRKSYDDRRSMHVSGKFTWDVSRDLTVAGFPAYEVMLRDEKSHRLRIVYVLASEAGRL